MRALSVRQPWAWAIIHAGKDIENRSWQAVQHGMRTGTIWIHASKGMTRDEYEDARDFMRGLDVACPMPADLIRGAIIGQVDVVDIVSDHSSPWFFGPRGLVLANAEAVKPIPCKGALGYFDWRAEGEIAAPLPWMLAWPSETSRRRAREPQPMPLFDD